MLVEDPVFSGDIQECSNSEVQKHPDFGELGRVISRNQYPVSANTGNDFRCNGLDRMYKFMQLYGKYNGGAYEIRCEI